MLDITRPVVFAGGSGVIGRATVSWFRRRHPDVPVIVAGRDLDRAHAVADDVGGADAATLDLDRPGIGFDGEASALVVLAPDHALHGLRFAQERGIPYLSTSTWLSESGAELAVFAHRPTIPVLLASHWWGGATTALALRAAKKFDSVESMHLGAIADEEDDIGPAAIADMNRSDGSAGVLAIDGGERVWLSGEAAQGRVRAVDGRVLDAAAYAPFDIASLLAATEAPRIRFDFALDVTSSRRRGEPLAAETVVELEGFVGSERATARSTLEFAGGQASITGLSLALLLAPLLGLDHRSPATPGLYLPELLIDADAFIDELAAAGAKIQDAA